MIVVVVVSHDDKNHLRLLLALLLLLFQTREEMMRVRCDINTQGVKEYFCSRSIEYQTSAFFYYIVDISLSQTGKESEELEKEEKFKNNREKKKRRGVFWVLRFLFFSLFFSFLSLSRKIIFVYSSQITTLLVTLFY